MTDNEIFKALYNIHCATAYKNTITISKETAIGLCEYFNRQKAEIERLQGEIGSLNKKYPCTVDVGNNCLVYARSLDDYDKLIGDISAEAVKEFAEKLKEKYAKYEAYETLYAHYIWHDIDNLLKEMVGDSK
ncbi:MAG: hypothetical protein E7365_06070 [Clostridiales bacterium]|nr:hypothetical protein [Clostridiales bacterium]